MAPENNYYVNGRGRARISDEIIILILENIYNKKKT